MSTVEEVKQRLDILEVIGAYTSLQKSGRNYRGLCPFHPEKNPSFYVYPEQQSWYCYGRCNGGGDVFAFVMKREDLSFGEALRVLAERAGVSLAAPSAAGEAVRREREPLYELNEAAARFYHRLLLSAAGEGAREYLKQRGVTEQSIVDFTLGYAPPERHTLGRHLAGLGYSAEQLRRAGLVTEAGYDLFHHRLLFPIREGGGRVAGFGGRALDHSLPKYLNSPATPVFDKKSLLYGQDRAREAIRRQDQAVIVEGYMDVVVAHQAGFAATVATMGVALTENQLRYLKQLTRHLVLALDADAAGVEAVLRGAETAARSLEGQVVPIPTWQGMVSYERILDAEIKVLALPPERDPDEVILNGAGEWEKLVSAAVPVMDFLLTALTPEIDLTRWEEKTALVKRLKPLFDEIKDPIRWGHYLQKLSRRLGVEERLLAASLHTPARSGRVAASPASPTYSPSLEEQLLALLLHFPELRGVGADLSPDLFEDTVSRELLGWWQQSPDLPTLRQGLEEPLREHLERLLERSPSPIAPPQREAALHNLALRLRQKHLRRRLFARKEALTDAGNASLAPLDELETELSQVNTQLREVDRELHSLGRVGKG